MFQTMQCTTVERTFCNLLFVHGRGRRSSSRTAHRLRLRSSPRTLSPSFLLSEKSHAASLLLACKRARDAPTCYQLFSVSSGKVNFFFTNRCRCRLFAVSSGRVLYLFSCRERTPGVPRWETRANAVRFYFPTQNFANTSFTVSSVTLLPVRLISSPRAQSMLTFTASSVSPPLSASSASLT